MRLSATHTSPVGATAIPVGRFIDVLSAPSLPQTARTWPEALSLIARWPSGSLRYKLPSASTARYGLLTTESLSQPAIAHWAMYLPFGSSFWMRLFHVSAT